MKKLADGVEVAARTFYYLLDFNDRDNWEYMYTTFDKKRLCDLNIAEYKQLFEYATKVDASRLVKH